MQWIDLYKFQAFGDAGTCTKKFPKSKIFDHSIFQQELSILTGVGSPVLNRAIVATNSYFLLKRPFHFRRTQK
jgi:hypothetical protein